VLLTDEDRLRLNTVGRRYHEALHQIAAAKGWPGAVDFCDLAKVIRLPGTINAKDPAAPVPVMIAAEHPARYNLGDLEELLPEIDGPKLFAVPRASIEAVGGAAGSGTISGSSAPAIRIQRPSKELIAALTEYHPLFSDTWHHARTDLNDDSCSGYDMAVAGIGVACGLSDEQIAGLIDENRRRFPRPKQARSGIHYQKYLARTLAKARGSQPESEVVDLGCCREEVSDGADGGELTDRAAVEHGGAGDTDAGPAEDVQAEVGDGSDDNEDHDAPEADDQEAEDRPVDPERPEESDAPVEPPKIGATPDPTPKRAITAKEIVRSIADRLMSEGRYARDEAERLYKYEGGRYVECDFGVRRKTQELMEKSGFASKWSSHRGREVVQYVMLKSPELWDEPPVADVNLKNGILNTHTGQLREHSPDFLSPIQIPVVYDPAATCPRWDTFIAEVFPADSIELAPEIIGDLITPDRSIQKSILLVGEGGNGKGVFLAGCIAFVGRENVTTVPLHKLESDRFSASRLYGKLVNCCADLPSEDLASTSMFKALTGGDIITGERKYENSFDFKPYARLLFSANHPPRSKDASKAFFDRWVGCPVRGEFPRDEPGAASAGTRRCARRSTGTERIAEQGAVATSAATGARTVHGD
jgi:P4 family phage/plasmid primase-like protien